VAKPAEIVVVELVLVPRVALVLVPQVALVPKVAPAQV